MSFLVGRYECKVDPKGRFIFPSGLKKLLPEKEALEFVLVKEREGYLVLYTKESFDQKIEELMRLDDYTDANEDYKREFFDTVALLTMDSAFRLMIPKSHLDEIKINKDITLLGVGKKIELWATENYPKSNPANKSVLKDKLIWDKLDKK